MSPHTTEYQSPLHFRRIEVKYLLPVRFIPSFVERLSPYTHPDPFLIAEGKGRTWYPVTSLYFDSIDLQSLQEKDSGVLARRRVRLRVYEEEFTALSAPFFEIKRRNDFIVSKDRVSLPKGILKGKDRMMTLLDDLLGEAEESEVRTEVELLGGWYNLQPTCLVQYKRIPFVGVQDERFRVTLDCELAGVWRPMSLVGPQLYHSCHRQYCVVEVKCHNALPSWFHDVIQEFQFIRTSHSKYALTVAAMRDLMTPEMV